MLRHQPGPAGVGDTTQTRSDQLKKVYGDISTHGAPDSYPRHTRMCFTDGSAQLSDIVKNVSMLVTIGFNMDTATVKGSARRRPTSWTGYCEHHSCTRTNTMSKRINHELRKRTRMVGSFLDGQSALMLITARIRYVTTNQWSTQRYLDMSRLKDMINRES